MGRLTRPADSSHSRRIAAWKHGLLWGLAGLLVVLFALGTRLWFWPDERAEAADPVAVAGPSTTAEPHETVAAPVPVMPDPPTTTSAAPDVPSVTVDVAIYGTQTSGLTAAREIIRADPHLRVAVISSGNYLESPLAQGLSAEDAREVWEVLGGAYKEWRDDVIDHYADLGTEAFTRWGRFVYEPEVAERYLRRLLERNGGEPIRFYSGRLVEASDSGDVCRVTIQEATAGPLVINAGYLIDSSVEADLARMLGCYYRIGRVETVYNDAKGPRPSHPSEENGYATAPQRLSTLLTLQVHGNGLAPPLSGSVPVTGGEPVSTIRLSPIAVASFGHSWSMVIAELPNGARELNETWSDYPDMITSYDWVFHPDRRPAITEQAARRALGQVSYLQQNGYPQIGVSHIPEYPYVREGPRVVGLETYTIADVLAEKVGDVAAMGCYAQYDRHDIFAPTQIDATATVRVPIQALMVAGHPKLLVSTAISTDYQAYSSAVRTELARANIGGAAGIIVVLAARMGVDPDLVPYEQIRRLLGERDYRLP